GCGGGGLEGNTSNSGGGSGGSGGGGGGIQPGTTPGTYIVTVTATSGSITHSMQLQLVVQSSSTSPSVAGSWLINAGSVGQPQVLIEANLLQDSSGNITATNGQIAAISKVNGGWVFGDCLSNQKDGMEHDSFQGTINAQGQISGTFLEGA